MMEYLYIILGFINYVIWGFMAIVVLYLLFFAIASQLRYKKLTLPTDKQARIAIIYPVYKEGAIVLQSLQSLLHQTYPRDLYRIVVVADWLSEADLTKLRKLPIELLEVQFQESSKAKALKHAMAHIGKESVDLVTILDVDNDVEVDFLEKINQAFQSGANAIQAHRKAKNSDTPTAVLDALSEEINNSIFRKGHVKAGLSAALIGSGIAFEAQWFSESVKKLTRVGEDKELEIMLHEQNIFIHYLDDVPVYDHKTSTKAAFYNQRRRWMAAQVEMLTHGIAEAYKDKNVMNKDYFDKLFQWAMPPRSIAIGFTFFMSIAMSFVSLSLAMQWWIIGGLYLLSILIAIPRKMYNTDLLRAALHVPILVLLMFFNILRIKGGTTEFIHTSHE